MKLYLEPVEVQAQAGLPQEVCWRGQHYCVREIQEKWLYHGRWWVTPQLKGRRRRYFRLNTELPSGARGVLEVFEEGGHWVLSRLHD